MKKCWRLDGQIGCFVVDANCKWKKTFCTVDFVGFLWEALIKAVLEALLKAVLEAFALMLVVSFCFVLFPFVSFR